MSIDREGKKRARRLGGKRTPDLTCDLSSMQYAWQYDTQLCN
jgi:hypothetical protein